MRVLRALSLAWSLVAGNTYVEKRVVVKGRSVRFQNRGEGAHMGRFGGGWQRELGIQMGSRGLRGTVIVNLWKGSIRIDPRKELRRA